MIKKIPPAAVLVVDDEEGMRTTLADILEAWFSRVDQVANGEEAVRKALERPYDLVLMDVRMPVLDGIQALQQIREHTPSQRIVLMTAYTDLHELAKVRSEVLAVLPKPLNWSTLMTLVHTVLEERVYGKCEI